MKGLEDLLFVSDWMADIGEAVGSGFDFLPIIMNTHRAFLKRFELFFEMNSLIIFIAGEQRG